MMFGLDVDLAARTTTGVVYVQPATDGTVVPVVGTSHPCGQPLRKP